MVLVLTVIFVERLSVVEFGLHFNILLFELLATQHSLLLFVVFAGFDGCLEQHSSRGVGQRSLERAAVILSVATVLGIMRSARGAGACARLEAAYAFHYLLVGDFVELRRRDAAKRGLGAIGSVHHDACGDCKSKLV